ncbi:MAG: Deoxyguanosinetriphosphate triphosphohydrolase-like protein [Candidatus Methanophagaceae archaeon]|nr:MAG: Deoxyguanosinetriphosphate triphosphohydrolase-like protein [Methanophagales archaeon]
MEDRNEILKCRIINEKAYMSNERSHYLRDRDRILFSRAFRRLAFKTQVVPASGRDISDHIRTRLTHSLEVMQIASSIALKVNSDNRRKLDIDLIQAISLGHDIGHTAYGHIGERVLSKFIFGQNGASGNNVKHNFQSLKVCCFLEKQYKPDFYGLNLTIATLDGILKHSCLDDEKRLLYKEIFNSYQKIFWVKETIDAHKREKLNEYLFEYVSPLTYEGIIVSITDEIAQLCHDIEDIRRLGGFESVIDFYEMVRKQWDEVEENSPEHKEVKEVYADFVDVFEGVKDGTGEVAKLERLYVKLILGSSIPIVSKVIGTLQDMDRDSRNNLLKEKYLGEFETIKELNSELKLNEGEIKLIEYLEEIFDYYKKDVLMKQTIVARWDLKGEELYEELSEKLFTAFKRDKDLNIIDSDLRGDLKRSYDAGEEFKKSQKTLMNGVNDLPEKFAVWDYLAGMTDSFIIKEYESLTFKHVEIR